MGAEVDGVDLASPVSDETFATLRDARHQRAVLALHDQNITDDHQGAFTEGFGPLEMTMPSDLIGDGESTAVISDLDKKVASSRRAIRDFDQLSTVPAGASCVRPSWRSSRATELGPPGSQAAGSPGARSRELTGTLSPLPTSSPLKLRGRQGRSPSNRLLVSAGSTRRAPVVEEVTGRSGSRTGREVTCR